VIANVTRPNVKGCHGVSIYFPYSFEENEDQQIRRLLGEAETGILNLPLVKGGSNNLRKARNGRIEELEADLERLPFFKDEGWGAFIKQGWSLLLARRCPDKLDLHYSAQQCARNLSAGVGHLTQKNKEIDAKLAVVANENKQVSAKLAVLAHENKEINAKLALQKLA
jgi:hypothetical protein